MKRRIIPAALIALLLCLNIFQFVYYTQLDKLDFVAVPDEATALKIAQAVFEATFGEESLKKEPFEVHVSKGGDCWVVFGSLPSGYVGGVPYIVIRMSDGKILSLMQGM